MCLLFFFFFFLFSSRRWHTRCSRDWSSDVCSSDLGGARSPQALRPAYPPGARFLDPHHAGAKMPWMSAMGRTIATLAALTAAAGLAAGVAWMARGPREAALRKAVSTTPRAEGRAAPATQSDSPPPPAPQPSSLTIAGRAIGEDGVAISGGKACLVRGNGEVVSRATTGADGAVSLQVVPAELEAGLVLGEVF